MTQYILTNKEMAKADLLTIESGISSLDLMFNAGKKVFNNLPVQRGKVKGRSLFVVREITVAMAMLQLTLF